MVQFYFLSIIANILGGLALSSGFMEERLSSFSGIKQFFESRPTYRVALGIVTVVTGVLKLLSVSKGDVPVVGDLLPALIGLLIGVALLFERYKEKSTLPPESQNATLNTVDKLVLRNKSVLGISGMAIGLLHFLIPGVLFL